MEEKKNMQMDLKLSLEKVHASQRPRSAMATPSVHGTSRITASRRRKLEELQDREALKGRRARLQALLLQKLAGKYAKTSVARRAAIEELVLEFVTNTDTVNEASLIDLENRVRSKVSGIKPPETGSGQENDVRPKTCDGITRPLSAGTAMASGRLAGQVSDWILMDAYKSIQAEDDMKEKRIQAIQTRRRLRQDLDRQINGISSLKKKDVVDKETIRSTLRKQHEEWKAAQERIKDSLHSKLYEEKEIRLRQIAEKEERAKKEREERLNREKREIAACQREIARQEELAKVKKREERERQQRIMVENERELERRKLEKQREAELDKHLMEEYAKKLEHEEYERAHAFQKRVIRMEKSGQKWAEEGAGKKKAEMERDLEEMILREAAKKEAADLERERRDLETRKTNLRRMAEENKRMAQEKERNIAQEKSSEAQWSSAYRREGEDFTRQQREQRMAELRKAKENRELLVRQIQEQHRTRKNQEMTPREKQINAKILKQLQEDEEMMARIAAKLYAPAKLAVRDSPIGVVNV